MGARIGYSAINGVVITLLCLCGAVSLILKVVPLEATLGILFWIAIFMTAQAFQEVPKKHALAVAFGLVPSLGAWAYFLIETTLSIAGSSMHAMKDKFGNQIFIEGVIALNQGFIVLAMIYSALLVFIIERNFLRAGLWCVVAALLSAAGIIHAYQLGPGGLQMKYGLLASPHFAVSYLAGALFLFAFHAWQKRFKEPQGTSPEGMHQEQKMG
jgi:AGZA family xanthine/uracil permease-like MFS transporter